KNSRSMQLFSRISAGPQDIRKFHPVLKEAAGVKRTKKLLTIPIGVLSSPRFHRHVVLNNSPGAAARIKRARGRKFLTPFSGGIGSPSQISARRAARIYRTI